MITLWKSRVWREHDMGLCQGILQFVKGRPARGFRQEEAAAPMTAASSFHYARLYLIVIGIPISGHRINTANPTITISRTLVGIPYMKNSPLVNCFDS